MIAGLGPDEIVLDTGPGIALDQLGYVNALSNEDDLMLSLPGPVANELAVRPDRPGGRLPEELRVRPIDGADVLRVQTQAGRPILGPGEVGVILAAEQQWSSGAGRPACAAIDDRDAWEYARARWGGVDRLCGTLSLLYLVHERGLERRPLRQDLEILIHSSHHLSEGEAAKFLRAAESLLPRFRARGATLPAGEAWLRRIREGGMQRRARGQPEQHHRHRSSTIE